MAAGVPAAGREAAQLLPGIGGITVREAEQRRRGQSAVGGTGGSGQVGVAVGRGNS